MYANRLCHKINIYIKIFYNETNVDILSTKYYDYDKQYLMLTTEPYFIINSQLWYLFSNSY
jgi:hypothetical protein